MKLTVTSLMLTAFAIASFSVAEAKPNVQLSLIGDIVEHQAGGADRLTPLSTSNPIESGKLIRYTVVAKNSGNEPARNLMPMGKIPSGTSYELKSSTSDAINSKVEFSIDNGKTWAAKPMVLVHTSQGNVQKMAEPTMYTAIRWNDKSLPAYAKATFSYEVRVK